MHRVTHNLLNLTGRISICRVSAKFFAQKKRVHVDMKREGLMGEYQKEEFVCLCFIQDCFASPTKW